MNPALAMPNEAEWRERLAARFAELVPYDGQVDRLTPAAWDALADAAPNARCRFCRRPSHTGECLDPLDRPGALRPPRRVAESEDDAGDPYACPALAYGPACPPCERRLAMDARRAGGSI